MRSGALVAAVLELGLEVRRHDDFCTVVRLRPDSDLELFVVTPWKALQNTVGSRIRLEGPLEHALLCRPAPWRRRMIHALQELLSEFDGFFRIDDAGGLHLREITLGVIRELRDGEDLRSAVDQVVSRRLACRECLDRWAPASAGQVSAWLEAPDPT